MRIPLSQQARRRREAIWRRQFWEHQIRDETDDLRRVDYIHFNPVKYDLVTQVSDWPYSSFLRHIRNGDLAFDWARRAAIDECSLGEA